jgi:RNA polymerase sigma factor (sigma-70 family)
MSELDDHQLLAVFARTESGPAFAALVARYVNLVYSTALRFTGNTHHAEEITQAVFIILARKAGKLSPRVVLSGWLYQVARLTSANFIKGEIRRQRREQEAYMQSTLNESTNDGWQEIAPLLDEAMGKLGKTDRDAVVLRYFENKSAAEIGAVLRMPEETARKRVNRALEKLHRYFGKHGISSTTAIIAGAISTNSVHAAPVMLAKTVTPVAIAKGSTATATTMTLVKGALKLMNWTRLKIAMATCVAILLAVGTTTLLAQHSSGPTGSTAAIPYKMLDDACRFADSIDQTKLVFRIILGSKNKSVHPADIHLTITSTAKGSIPLKLGAKGEILNFPHDDALRQENPSVNSDQPKGTLQLGAWCFVPVPKGSTFPYSKLADAIAEAKKGNETVNKMIKEEGYKGVGSPFSGTIRGVVFVFPKSSAGKAKVEVTTATGKKEYAANKNGYAQVAVEEALIIENPEVTVSEKPQWIGLDGR